jgi:hypothetical protein
MTALLLIFGLLLPRDTTLVEVMLVTTAERTTVEAIVEPDSTVRLPSSALRDLLGVSFIGPWVSVEQLRAQYPTLVVQWRPAELRVLVFDELRSLPATRKFYETHRAAAFNTMAIPQVSGLFGGVAVDDQRRVLADLGWLYKGRLQLAGRIDDRGTNQWNLSAAPTSRLFVNATGGTRQPTSVSSRVQVGPIWLSATYAEQRPIEVAGLVRGGPVQVFASRQYGVLTVTPSGSLVTVQVARRWADRSTAARISFGPSYASAFSFPVTSIR